MSCMLFEVGLLRWTNQTSACSCEAHTSAGGQTVPSIVRPWPLSTGKIMQRTKGGGAGDALDGVAGKARLKELSRGRRKEGREGRRSALSQIRISLCHSLLIHGWGSPRDLILTQVAAQQLLGMTAASKTPVSLSDTVQKEFFIPISKVPDQKFCGSWRHLTMVLPRLCMIRTVYKLLYLQPLIWSSWGPCKVGQIDFMVQKLPHQLAGPAPCCYRL